MKGATDSDETSGPPSPAALRLLGPVVEVPRGLEPIGCQKDKL